MSKELSEGTQKETRKGLLPFFFSFSPSPFHTRRVQNRDTHTVFSFFFRLHHVSPSSAPSSSPRSPSVELQWFLFSFFFFANECRRTNGEIAAVNCERPAATREMMKKGEKRCERGQQTSGDLVDNDSWRNHTRGRSSRFVNGREAKAGSVHHNETKSNRHKRLWL